MAGKIGLLAITLLGLSAFGGCETMYGKSQCPGGCCGGSCATGSTYAAPQASQGGYVPSSPAGAYGGGSGTK